MEQVDQKNKIKTLLKEMSSNTSTDANTKLEQEHKLSTIVFGRMHKIWMFVLLSFFAVFIFGLLLFWVSKSANDICWGLTSLSIVLVGFCGSIVSSYNMIMEINSVERITD
jgi:hypothetical protein